MAIRPIVRYPDPASRWRAAGDRVRRRACASSRSTCATPCTPRPASGSPRRISASRCGSWCSTLIRSNGARTYVNPEIVWASPETILHQEGSVSMPGVNDDITRHARVRISFHDLDGNPQTEESDGLRAVCHQHEIDQLNGMFWIQRLSRLKRERLIKRFEKMARG